MVDDRKDITLVLSKAFEKYINPTNDPRIYYAKEVTFDYGTSKQVRVDYMRFKPINNSISGIEKGDFYCYEIKSCLDDFNSKNGHNFIGDYNYYVMTRELYGQVKGIIPYYVGVLVNDGCTLISVKRSQRKDREKPLSEMMLMMFRSSNRDRNKTLM
ncbi:MAG: hypothetical protein RR945_02070 [Erysipelotrichaceae bacterium]